MAISSNQLRKIVDLPVWEWLRFSPITNAIGSVLVDVPGTGSGATQNRYLYLIQGSNMYKYDTWSDGWVFLGASAPGLANTITAKWKNDDGYYGNCISSSGNVVYGPFIGQGICTDYDIEIYSGPGRGQRRRVISTSDTTAVEYFTVTGFSYFPNAAYISDSSKKWVVNQWKNYQFKIYLGTSQQYLVRTILANNNDTLFFSLQDFAGAEPHQFQFITDANKISPSTAYGSRGVIEYNSVTVDTPFTTELNKQSEFLIHCGALHAVHNAANAPFYNHYSWNPLAAYWFTRRSAPGVIPSYLAGSDLSLMPIDSTLVPVLYSGSITAATDRTITDSTKNWTYGSLTNLKLKNKTTGFEYRIVGNTSNTVTFGRSFEIPNSASHQYDIIVDDDKMYLNGGNFSTMAQYSFLNNSWYTSQRFDEGVANVAYVRYSSSYEQIHPISSISRTGQVATAAINSGFQPFQTGDRIFVSGALGPDSQYYNGFFTVTSSYPLSTTMTGTGAQQNFTYWMPGTPSANAVLNTPGTNPVYDMSKNWIPNEHVGRILQVFEYTQLNSTTQYRLITSNTSQSLTLQSALGTSLAVNVPWTYNIISSASFGASWGDRKSVV